MLAQLAVGDGDPRPRGQRPHAFGDRVDGLDAVVHEVHLAAAIQLARQRLLEQRVIPRLDEREHRRAVLRRRLEQRQVAQAGQREVQRARDRRGGEGQHVHAELQRLEPLLVPHPKAMLLVHDEQSQVLEPHVPGQQPVRPDHDVHLALGETLRHGGGFLRRAEPRQHLDAHGIVGEALAERAAVLFGENRRRHQHGGLLARLDRLERRPDRDLRFAVPDVADEEPVHRPGALHVALHVHGGAALVGRVFIKERGFELRLPRRIGGEGVARGDLAARVQVQEVERHSPDRRLGFLPLALPGRGPEPVQPRRRRVGAAVAARAVRLQLVEAVQRHIEAIASLVFDGGHVECALPHRDRLQAAVNTDAVLQVHHVVARTQRAGSRRWRRGAVAARTAQPPRAPEDLVIGEHAEAGHDEPAVQRPHHQGGAIGAEQLLEALELAFVVAEDHRRRLASHQLPQAAQIAVHGLRGEHGKALRGVRGAGGETRASGEPRPPRGGIEQQLLARRRLLAEPPRDLEVMRRVGPGTLHLALDRRFLVDDEQGISREQIQKRRADPSLIPLPPSLAGADRQHAHTIDRLGRALGIQVEPAQRHDLVAPPLDARRHRHPESVDVQDPAAHAELTDLGHAGNPLITHVGEPLRGVRETGNRRPVTGCQLQTARLQHPRHSRALGAGPRRRDDHAGPARQQRRDRLDALARDLHVGLVRAEPFALRVQDRPLPHELLQVREPALGVGGGRGDDREEPLREPPRERGDEQRRAGPREAGER
ncbi:MAG: hypothetical protein AUG10_02365 [Gemmatimonadetes bacterium 13_1_20CM_2_70_10]|nr:MAG: hypothetical protein AUG10_02365 [Gemmatimonadetes bacterium 13_1_20CM_2_70_10]